MPLDSAKARELLDRVLAEAESKLLRNAVIDCPARTENLFDAIFQSNTQAYRETLVGCVLAKIQDSEVNIRLPYKNLGPKAFNGRTLDERVVNPFLQQNRIPCSRGPFLSAFRRSVRFDESTRAGLRDKPGYDAFLELLSLLDQTDNGSETISFLEYLIFRFVQLREAASVPLHRLQRMSLEQYDQFIGGLLAHPSGGRLPVLLVVATLSCIKEFFGVNWSIVSQGINVADVASGISGDIVITTGDGEILMSIEVTERPIDRSRVEATFNTKIAPEGIGDYLFFTDLGTLSPDARATANRYFSQGHEVNFLQVRDWIFMLLATLGKRGRGIFSRVLIQLMDGPDIPRSLKVAWNERIGEVLRLG